MNKIARPSNFTSAQPKPKYADWLSELNSTTSYRALEPRIAFDGAAAATAAVTVDQQPDGQVHTSNTATGEPQAAPSGDASGPGDASDLAPASGADLDAAADDLAVALSASPAASDVPRQTIVFIDNSVENIDQIISTISPDSEIVLINGQSSGIDQISAHLSGRTNIDSIHIVSHGALGTLYVGGDTLTTGNISNYSAALANIGAALSDGGDILIYGCDIAQGDGMDLIRGIAGATGADVAASIDTTSGDEGGGDWVLEATAGAIETRALENPLYAGVLQKTNTGAGANVWTIAGATASNNTDGITTTISFTSLSANANVSGLTNDTLNTIAVFDNGAQGSGSLNFVYTWDTTPEAQPIGNALAANDAGTVRMTITFSRAVTDPVIHIDRLGGSTGSGSGFPNSLSNSSQIAIDTAANPGATLTELSGVGHFDTTSTTIVRTINQVAIGAQSSTNSATGTAAGSVRVNGTFTTLTFILSAAPGTWEGGGADGLEIALAIDAPPVAVNDTFTTVHDTAIGINVRSNDSDIRGDAINVTRVNGTAITAGGAGVAVMGGTVTLNTGGNLVFTPTANYAGATSFTYTIADANGGTSTATVSGTVTNASPALDLDSSGVGTGWTATYSENGSAISIADIDAVVNDADDANMESASITLTNPQTGDRFLVNGSSAASGTLASGITWTRTDTGVTLSGSFTKAQYAAAIQLIQFENTTDTPSATPRIINTTVNDGNVNSNIAVTTINIDRAPDPTNDAFSGNEDATISANVLTNDTDTGDGPAATPLTLVTGPTNGTLTSFNTTTGAFVYTPTGNFSGTDTFTYRYTDADGDSKTATVTLTVNPVDDAPVNTLPGSYTVVEDQTLKLSGLSISDIDAASGSMTVTLAIPAGTGTITATTSGGVTIGGSGTTSLTLTGTVSAINAYLAATASQPVFTPAADFTGPVTLTMTTNDNGNTGSGGPLTDIDMRTISVLKDTDGDAIADQVDIDDDNDGVLDVTEMREAVTNGNFSGVPSGQNTSTVPGWTLSNGQVYGLGGGIQFHNESIQTLSQSGLQNLNAGLGQFGAAQVIIDIGPSQGSPVNSSAQSTFTVMISGTPYATIATGAGANATATVTYLNGAAGNLTTMPIGGGPSHWVIDLPANVVASGTLQLALDGFTGDTSNLFPNDDFNVLSVSIAVTRDSDADGLFDHLDIDSDNDGITDNVEAQTTAGYIASTGLDTDKDGLDNAYDATSGAGAAGSNGLTPVNTDGADLADYLDSDTDNDGLTDAAERGTAGSTTVATGLSTALTDADRDGLFDVFEGASTTDGFDVNDENVTGTVSNLADTDGDAAGATPLTADRDWRDDVSPTGTDNTVTTPEDSTKVFAASDFPFSDAGGQPMTRVRIDSLPALGTLKLNGVAVSAGQIVTLGDITSGKLSWTPPADNNGAALASFTFSVGDARTFDAAPNTMTLNVTPVADIANDAVSTSEDTAVTFNVISGTNGATIDTFEATPSLTSFTSPSNGAVTVAANGTMTYTPAPNFSGVDSFTYTVTSGGRTETATVTVTVNAVNDVPVLDLNSTASTADTDRGFNTTFATGSPTAIAIADTDADIFEDGENDVTKLTIVAGGTSLASTDRVTIAGQTFALDTNATFNNVTAGGSSVNITYVASTRTFTITNAAGTTTPINQSDLDTLVRGTTYLSTSVTQPPSNRTFSFTATDAGNNTSPAAIATVAFLPPPNAVDDSFTTAHDTPLAIAVLSGPTGDTDPQGDTLHVTHVNGTAIIPGGPGVNVTGGVVTLDSSDNLVFTPNANYAGPTSFTYTIGDGTGGQDTATVTGTVTNVAPVLDLNSGISSGEQITNGGNPGGTGWTDNGANSALATSGTATGMFVFNNNDSSPVTLTQTGVAGWDTGSAPSGAAQLTFDFLWFRNGSGATGGAEMEIQVGGVTYAKITSTGINDPATITYSNGASGTVSGSALVVNITNGSTVPIVLNLPSSVAATGDLVFSYTSSNPNKIDFAIDNVSVIATAEQTAGNNFSTTYTENGTAVSIADTDNTVRDNDDTNMESASVTLTNPQTGDRLLVNGSAGTTGTIGAITWTRTDTTVTFSGSASEADYAAAIRAVQFENTATSTNATPRIIHSIVNDGSVNSNTAVTTIDIDLAPDPANDAFSGNEDVAITGDVDANDTDTGSGPGANPLAVVTGPTNGTLTSFNTATGTFVYTPNGNFNGTDTFTYSYTDIDGDTKTATVTLTVNAVNDAPVNTVPATLGPVAEDGTLAITGVSVADVDNATLTTTVSITNGVLNLGTTGGATVTGAGSGSVTLSGTSAQINAALATLSFVPTADYNGTAAFQISTTDGTLTDTDNRTITVTPVVDIANDTVTTNEDAAVTFAPLANDSFENAGRTISAINGSSITAGGPGVVIAGVGTVTLDTLGNLTFTPVANYNGAPSFTYTVTSGGVTETATVNMTVNAINDAPTQTVPVAQTTNEDVLKVITGASVADADVGTITTTLTIPAGTGTLSVLTSGTAVIAGNGSGTVTISGTAAEINAAIASITYVPEADYNGSVSMGMSTTDGTATASANVAITVTPVADITNDAVTTNEDTAHTFNVLTGTNGATADTFEGIEAVTGVTQPANGSVAFAADGTITYTPSANFNGTDTFTYTVTSGGVTETATVTVTVTAVNDAPVNTVPGAQATNEDTSIVFNAANGNAISVVDVDSNVTTTLTVANGTLNLGSISGVTVTGNGTGTVTVSGTPAAITAALSGLTFAPTPDWNGATTLNVSTSDGVNPADVDAIAITVSPVVDINPDGATTAEDTPRTINVLATDNFENASAVISSVTQPANGSVTIGAGGNVTYTPAANYTGTDTFTYTVTSGGVTETTTVTMTVTPVNDAPVAAPAANQTGTDGQADSYNAGALFTDVDNATLSFSASGLPAGLTINPATGLISGTIDSHASTGGTAGVYSVTVTATDASGALATTTFTWTVANPAPVAQNDAYTGTEDVAITGNVRANDIDPDGDALTVNTTPVSGPSNGTLVLNSNGTFTYTPANNFTGTDRFTYEVTDADGAATTATVTLYVNPINDSPLNAVPGNQTTGEDTPLVFTGPNAISVTDVDSPIIETTISVAHGTLTLGSLAGVTVTGDGTGSVVLTGSPAAITAALNGLSYENTPDYNGPDTLTIVSTDGIATTTANLAITVSPVADIAADTVSGTEDSTISFNVLTGANGATADAFEGSPVVTGFTQPANGSVTVDGAGNVVYTPNTDFNGTDTFSYTVTSGGVTETTTVTVNVAPANDVPTQTLPIAQNVTEDTAVTFSGANGNQIIIGDIDAGAAVTTTVSVPAGVLNAIATPGVTITGNGTGTVTFSGTPAAVTAALNGLGYTPVADYNGSVIMSVSTTDGVAALPATGTVTINLAAVADIANDSTSTNEDTPKTIAVLGNDTFENAGAAVTSVTNGANGSVTINGDGTVTYTPNANFNGSDTFTYTVTSGGVTETATVTVVVNPVNDAPTQVVPPAQATAEDSGLTFSGATGNAITVADVDGDTLTTTVSVTNGTIDLGAFAGVTATGDGTGTVTLTGSAAAINAVLDGLTYNPTADYNGSALMSVTTTDGASSVSNTIALTVTPVADIVADSVTTNEDTPVTIPVMGNDSFENSSASITSVTQPANGTVSIGAGGVVVYTPNANYHGSDSFTCTVTSGGVTETTTVSVVVDPVNDAPVTNVPAGQATNEDVPLVLSNANGNAITIADVDGDTITVTLSGTNGVLTLGSTLGVTASGNGTGTITVTGTAAAITSALNGLSFTPTADYNGSAGISVTTSDGTVTTSSTVGITVNPVTDIVADSVSTNEDVPVTINVLTNDTFESSGAAVTSVTQGAIGSVSFLADGTVVYTPNTNFHGTDTFTYTVTSGGVTETTTVTVTIGDVNDIPTTTGIGDRNNLDGQTVSLNAAASFADNDGEALTYSATGLPLGLSINPTTGIISGTIDKSASQSGPYTVLVTASDGHPGGTVSTSFTWNVANPGPTAVNDTSTTNEDTLVNIDILANDTDPDGDPLTVTAATAGNGTVTIKPDGTIDYTPSANFNGTDTIVYQISDGNGGVSTATVTVTINPVNDAPTAITPLPNLTDADSQSVSLDFAYAFSDIDGDTLTYSITGLPAGLSFDTATGRITGTLDASASIGGPNSDGIYSIAITGDDGNGGIVTTTFTWTILNLPPTSGDDAVKTPEDTPVVATVLSNDFDPDGDQLTITHINGTAISIGNPVTTEHGVVSLSEDAFGNQVLTYVPDPNFNGVESIIYSTSDGNTGVDTATLTITVTPVNDAPTVDVLANLTNNDSDAVSVNVSSFFQDIDSPEGDTLTFSAVGLPAGITINPVTGIISGTIDPSASQSGPYTVVVTGTDSGGAPVSQTFTWTVNNPKPTALNDSNTIAEGIDLSVNAANGVLSNDSDPDSDPLKVSAINGNAALVGASVAGSSGGLFTVNPDGSYTFDDNGAFEDLQSGESRTTTLTYTISDGNGGVATAELTVTVTGTNDAPVATALAPITTVDNAPLTLNAAASFTDADGDTLTFSATGLPTGLSIDPATGLITGTIDKSASQGGTGGVYTVTILADDGNGGVTPVTLSLTVTNPAPNAGDDVATTNEDTPVTGTVAGNDSDPDGNPLTFTKASDPTNGTVVVNPNGTYTYTPNADFHGTDSFTYTVDDGNGGTKTQTVTITINPVNDAPVSTPLAAQSSADNDPVSVNVSGNFSDIDGDTLTYSATGLPPGLAIDPDTGIITGTIDHLASENGPYSVTVYAEDPDGVITSQTFTWNVANPSPVGPAIPDAAGVDGTSVNLAAGTGFADPDGDTLTFSATGLPPGLAINPATGEISGTLTTDASVGGTSLDGVYSITVTATDSQGANVSKTFTYTVSNPAPVAGNDAFQGTEDTPVTGTVAANDSDQDGDVLTYAVLTPPAHGSVIFNSDGTFTYTPNLDYNAEQGIETFTYTVTDANGATATATVTLNIAPVNDAPVAQDVIETTLEDTPFNGLLTATDADKDLLTFTKASDPANGTVVVNPDGTYTYTPNSNFHGPDSFTYTVSDGKGGSVTHTVTINVTTINDDPVAADDAFTGNEDNVIAGDVTPGTAGQDSDIDGDTLVVFDTDGDSLNGITPVTGPAHGTLVLNADGTFVYTPEPNFNGTDSFVYRISDGNGGFSEATVSLTVNPVNDAPVAANDALTTKEDQPFTGKLPVATDVEGNPVTYTKGSNPAHGTVIVNPDGTYVYKPAPNYHGPDSFTYTVSDGKGGVTTYTVTILVTPVNDAPVATNNTAAVRPGSSVSVPVLGNDTDVDGDKLTVTKATAGQGTVRILPDGSISYTPRPGFSGTDKITYIVSDGHGGYATATVSIVVEDAGYVEQPIAFGFDGSSISPDNDNGGYESIGAEGAVVDAVFDIGSLRSLANQLSADGAVLAAANGARNLGGVGSLGANGVIVDTIRAERAREMLNYAGLSTRVYGGGIDGLTGFSLRNNVPGNLGGLSSSEQLVIDSLVRNRTLIVQISNTIDPGTKRIIDYRITRADGTPLPEWLDRAGKDLLIGERSPDEEIIQIRVEAVYTDGSVAVQEVQIETSTGEIQLLKPGKQGSVAPALFGDQFRARPMLTPEQIQSLGRAIAR